MWNWIGSWAVSIYETKTKPEDPHRRSWFTGNALDLSSGGAQLESWPRHWLCWLSFCGSAQFPQVNIRIVPWLGHKYFLLNLFQSIILLSDYIVSILKASLYNVPKRNDSNKHNKRLTKKFMVTRDFIPFSSLNWTAVMYDMYLVWCTRHDRKERRKKHRGYKSIYHMIPIQTRLKYS
jgi:hypothetical protein